LVVECFLFLVAPASVVLGAIVWAWSIGVLTTAGRTVVATWEGLCPRCGYVLAGLPHTKVGGVACPECGESAFHGVMPGRERAGWGWWSLAAVLGVLAALPLVDLKTGMAGVRELEVIHSDAVFFPPAVAGFLGLALVCMAVTMTRHVRLRERWCLLMLMAALQVAGAVSWTCWEGRALASMG
jgi:hypothetical protein